MPYVRTRGHQLAIVHGERAAGTRNVQQRILATIYSKPEALAILGRGGDPDSAQRFRSLLEHRHTDVSFDWAKLAPVIAANLDVLPDDFEYETARRRGEFRIDLCAFVRQLAITDPQDLATSADVIRKHRHELAYVGEMIAWCLKTSDPPISEWTADDCFGWRFATRGYGRHVPPHTEEHAAGYYERGEYERARAIFQLLADTFPEDAESHNYLGLIALATGDPATAVRHFETTITIGRRQFPKRIAKRRYWSDLDTRPYMRGLRNLALTLVRLGRFDDAERILARLADECGDDLTADYQRAGIALDRANWDDAITTASRLVELYPECDFLVAFAAFELDRHDRILPAFVHAAANYPRTARMLLGTPDRAIAGTADDIRDHNCGVALGENLQRYLTKRSPRSRRYFKALLADPRIARILDGVLAARRRDQEQSRSAGDREAFDYLHQVRSRAFAVATADELDDLLPRAPRTGPAAREPRR
jgi:tetratricopeptide (TPR) repeat protein